MNESHQQTSLWSKLLIVAPVVIVHSLIYRYLTYHVLFPSMFPVTALQPTWVDLQIPFVVETVWPYIAMVVVTIAAPLSIRNRIVFAAYIRAYVAAILMAVAVYVFFPTAIVRQSMGEASLGLSMFAYRQFAEGLGHHACLPSGHILFPMIGCWGMIRDQRRGAIVLAISMLLVSPSILTLKEHVAWDWLAGIAVGAIAIGCGEWSLTRFRCKSRMACSINHSTVPPANSNTNQ